MRPHLPPEITEAAPIAAAIGVFGVVYGSTATAVLGPVTTVASSLLMFSGAAQFTMVGLLDTGATPAAVLMAITILNLRHLPLAAIVLPRLDVDRRRRSLVALVLIDETSGLAVASRRSALRTMAVAGTTAYLAWVAGTVAGVLGAELVAVVSLADAVFVILFSGLAVLTCRDAGDVVRGAVAAALTAGLLITIPSSGVLAAIAAATGAAVLGRRTP